MVDANLNELETPPGENFPKKLPFSGMVSTHAHANVVTPTQSKYFYSGPEDI